MGARPRLVLVTGAPGSGKTTLGVRLADALRVPFLSRDAVRGGLLATSGLWTGELDAPAEREAAWETFVRIAETVTGLGVSAVLEIVITPERVDALRRLDAVADCVVVLTACADPSGRAEARDRSDPLLNRPAVLDALGLRTIDEYLAGPEREKVRATMRTDFDLPVLAVRTDDVLEPPLEDIVDWVIGQG